jgi:hypothetical protein
MVMTMQKTLAALAAAATLAACSDNVVVNPQSQQLPAAETQTVDKPLFSITRASAPAIEPCAPVATYALTDGRHVIGNVKVMNDSKNLYVTYTVTAEHWWISDTRVAIEKTYAAIPQDNNHVPLPWDFPHAGVHEPVLTSVTHEMTLEELGVGDGDNVVVAAMAGAVHPKDESNYEGDWEWMVMWGIGNIQGNSIETVHNYTVKACPGQIIEQPPALAGRITITFDDGFRTTYDNAYPILKELGIKANVAVNGDPVDGEWPDYMTMDQLKELQGQGWGFVSHSLSHRDLTTLSDADLEHEVRDSKLWLENHGFGTTDVFIVPFHAWGERERAMIKKYYGRARGYTVNQFTPAKFVKMPYAEPYDVTGFEPEFAPFTTAEGRALTLSYVERAVKEGEVLDLFFHRLPADKVPAFRELMTEVAKYKANIGTW